MVCNIKTKKKELLEKAIETIGTKNIIFKPESSTFFVDWRNSPKMKTAASAYKAAQSKAEKMNKWVKDNYYKSYIVAVAKRYENTVWITYKIPKAFEDDLSRGIALDQLKEDKEKSRLEVAIENGYNSWEEFIEAEENFEYSLGFEEKPDYKISNYKKTVDFKEQLISRLKGRISKISSLLLSKDVKKDPDLYKQLSQERHEFSELLIDLEEELEDLLDIENNPQLFTEKVIEQAEKDFQLIEDLLQSGNQESAEEVERILGYYLALGDFNVTKNHPMFSEQELQGDNIPQEVIDVFKALQVRAEVKKKLVTEIYTKNLEATYNAATGMSMSIAEIRRLEQDNTRGDINWVDMYFMDIAHGIFSSNGTVPQIAKIHLSNIYEDEKAILKRVVDKVDKLTPKVEKVLSEMKDENGKPYTLGGIGILGLRNVSYRLFFRKDQFGNNPSELVQPFTKSFERVIANIFNEANKAVSENRKLKDGNVARQLNSAARITKLEKLRKNAEILDVRKLDFGPRHSEVEQMVGETITPDIDYIDKLKSKLGDRVYEILLEQQLENIEKWKVWEEKTIKDFLATAEVTSEEELTQDEKINLAYELRKNSPFQGVYTFNNISYINSISDFYKALENNPSLSLSITYKNFDGKTSYRTISNIRRSKSNPDIIIATDSQRGEETRFNVNNIKQFNTRNQTNITFSNNVFIPLDNSHIDSNFQRIASNDTLYEFYEVAKESARLNYESSSFTRFRNPNSIYHMKEPWFTTLLSYQEIGLHQAFIQAARSLWQTIVSSFGTRKENQLSYTSKDPITGEVNYEINNNFFTKNNSAIKANIEVKLAKLSLIHGDKVDRKTTMNPNKMSRPVLDYFLSLTNISEQEFLKQYQDVDLRVYELLESIAIHETVQNQSMNLPKIIKYSSQLSAEYRARTTARPIMNLLKNFYKSIDEVEKNNIGETMYKLDSKGNVTEQATLNERKRAIRQYEDWEKRQLYGIHRDKKQEYGLVQKPITINVKGKTFTLGGTIYSKEELQIKKEIEDTLSKLDPEKDKIHITNLQEQLKALGKTPSLSALVDNVLEYLRLQGLGWNLPASFTNFTAGTMSNLVNSVGEEDYSMDDLFAGYRIVYSSMVKNLTFGKIAPGQSKKMSVVMKRYDILQDNSNELQKSASEGNLDKFLGVISPYEPTRRVEYVNQAPIAYAMLKNRMITLKNGEKISVWDALDNDGNIREDLKEQLTEEQINNWQNAHGKEYNKFKVHITDVIETYHGNYAELSGMMAKSNDLGRALLMFKTWLPNMIYNRFGVEQYNLAKGRMDKGRYRSLTRSSAGALGATAGFAMGGPVGMLLGAGIGTASATMFNKNQYNVEEAGMTPVGFMLHEYATMFKTLGRMYVGIPVGMITGKSPISLQEDMSKFEKVGFSQKDIQNYQKMIVDVYFLQVILLLQLIIKGFLWDDDDEKDDPKRKMHNLLMNETTKSIGETTMFLNPNELVETVTSLPLTRFGINLGRLSGKVNKAFQGEDLIMTGQNAGKSGVKEAVKTLLPSAVNTVLEGDFTGGFAKKMERQYQPNHLDGYFKSKDSKINEERSRIRMKYRKQMVKENPKLDKKEIEKLVNSKYPPKKKGQTEEEVLKLYKSVK